MRDDQRLSTKFGRFHPSLTLELKTIAQDRRRQGLPVWDFGLGETKGALAAPICAAAVEAYRAGETMYGDPAGLGSLRGKVLEWLGVEDQYDRDSVVITTGAKQSLFNVMLAVCNPADCVLFDAAPWVSYEPLAIASYASSVMVEPSGGEAARLKVSAPDLEEALRQRPHARLFLLNSPVNPTGQMYTAEELEGLLRVCVAHRVYLVLDRLYWRIVFDGAEFPEPRVDAETRDWLIQVDGMSKNFRRTGGLRIGWTVAPPDLAAAMVNLQSHYTSGPSRPAQLAALAAITEPYDWELRDALERKRDRIWELRDTLESVQVWPTSGAFYSFWRVSEVLGRKTPEGERLDDTVAVSRYLLDRAGVVTAPGSAFLQEGFLRISFAVPDEEIEGGMAACAEAFAALRS